MADAVRVTSQYLEVIGGEVPDPKVRITGQYLEVIGEAVPTGKQFPTGYNNLQVIVTK